MEQEVVTIPIKIVVVFFARWATITLVVPLLAQSCIIYGARVRLY